MRRSLVLCSCLRKEGWSRFRKSEAFITGMRDTRRKSAGSKLQSYLTHLRRHHARLHLSTFCRALREIRSVRPGTRGHPPRMASRDPSLGRHQHSQMALGRVFGE
jgi:hypothetical protein